MIQELCTVTTFETMTRWTFFYCWSSMSQKKWNNITIQFFSILFVDKMSKKKSNYYQYIYLRFFFVLENGRPAFFRARNCCYYYYVRMPALLIALRQLWLMPSATYWLPPNTCNHLQPFATCQLTPANFFLQNFFLHQFFSFRQINTKPGPKGPIIAAKGCRSPQELEKSRP